MLILQRKPGESLLIGEDIEVSILGIESGRVRIAVKAPKQVPILRSELKRAAATNHEAAEDMVSPLELLNILSKSTQ